MAPVVKRDGSGYEGGMSLSGPILMRSQSVLIAETDPRTLDSLPRILCAIPHIAIDTCRATDELCSKLESVSYNTVALSATMLQTYRAMRRQRTPLTLTPLIVTVGEEDRTIARDLLERDAFGLIVKPINPYDAAQTVRLALWQNKLLSLLSYREFTTSWARQHLAAFPYDWKAEMQVGSVLATFERTLQAVMSSFRLLEAVEGKDEGYLFDVAQAVEQFAKQQALDRLFNLYKDGPSH